MSVSCWSFCQSVGWSIGWSCCFYFLKEREVTLQCSCRSTCLVLLQIQGGGYETIRVHRSYVLRSFQCFSMINHVTDQANIFREVDMKQYGFIDPTYYVASNVLYLLLINLFFLSISGRQKDFLKKNRVFFLRFVKSTLTILINHGQLSTYSPQLLYPRHKFN